FVERLGGTLRVRKIGGRLLAEKVGEVDVETVGGKAKVIESQGNVRIGRVGGRFSVDGIRGDVRVDRIGGHASASGVTGDVELAEVGGAVDMRAPFPAGKSWHAQSHGRISVEVDDTSAIQLAASAGWGRVRLYGVDASELERTSRSRVEGRLGAERAEGDRTRLTLETRSADIIIARAGSYERDYCWGGRARHGRRGFSFPGAFDELGEILSEEFGEKIPDFVGSILGAAGRIVANSGAWSGSFLREVAEDAARSMRDALAEAKRGFDDLGQKLPRDIGETVEDFGRQLAEIIRRAATEGRARTQEGRRETRDRIRAAAREMRDAIQELVREARERSGAYEATRATKPQEQAQPTGQQTRPFTAADRQSGIMDILNKVKAGQLEPEEADEMIAALMEVEEAAESRRPGQ
ncbi:MAG TPA: hypothetical protein VKE70_09570, partial [Candidatus Solibacter sp.]|nr:hypothetical protein [Candidatus Solibacter sp.]